MSEAITKACETCAGIGRPMTFWNGVVDCVDCSGTGRVPDEVATLRAQLDAARAGVARLTADRDDLCDRMGRDTGRLTTQAQIVRLTLASALGRGHEERDVVELAADVVRVTAELRGHVAELDGRWRNNADLTAELDAARAEVERLKADVTSLDALARGERAMVDTANDVIADLRAKISECAALGLELGRRLTERDAELDAARAEVERLTAGLATVRADHRRDSGTILAVAAAYNGWAIRGVEQHRAEYALEQIGKALRAVSAEVAEVARLTAEVDRLTTREREAARILSFASTAHASAWSAEAETWLAGCAPEVTHG